MFNKGDKIVYPMYGAGVIEGLEEKITDGVTETYYTLNIPITNLKIQVSASKAEVLGIREVYTGKQVMGILHGEEFPEESTNANWNQRYKENLDKIKSGQLAEVITVFKSLLNREKLRALSSAEKKMLTTARQIIVSEIMISQNTGKDEAETILINSLT